MKVEVKEFPNIQTFSDPTYLLIYLNVELTDNVVHHRQTRGNIYSKLQWNHVTAEQTPQQKFHLHTSLISIHMSSCSLAARGLCEKTFCTIASTLRPQK